MKPPKEYLKNLKHHTITEKMLSDCIYSINNRALNSRDNEYKYTHYIPNTYGNANKYHKKKLEYYQMKKVLLSILEPAHIQKGEVLQRKRTYDYEEGYEDILKSGNYVNNSGFYDPDRKEHVEFVVQMIPETVYYLTYTLSNRTFRVPLEESRFRSSRCRTDNASIRRYYRRYVIGSICGEDSAADKEQKLHADF